MGGGRWGLGWEGGGGRGRETDRQRQRKRGSGLIEKRNKHSEMNSEWEGIFVMCLQ